MKPFERVLARSFVYARIRSNECDISFTTNQSNNELWILLSGLSLLQIPNLAVIALPISVTDIRTGPWHRTNIGHELGDEDAASLYKYSNMGSGVTVTKIAIVSAETNTSTPQI